MSENNKRAGGEPFVDRRSSNPGIKSGGRRKSDRRLIEGSGKKAKIWIALSFGISACIIAWAFSLPFRGGNAAITLGSSDAERSDVEARPVSRSEARESDEEYLQEIRYLEEDLKRQLEEKRRAPKDLPGQDHARKAWKRGLHQRVNDAKLLTELADGKIEKGTIEWHAQQDLKDYLQDVPQ